MKGKMGKIKSAKMEAGARMAAAHRSRMEDFVLPTSGSCKPSEDGSHCTGCFEMETRTELFWMELFVCNANH